MAGGSPFLQGKGEGGWGEWEEWEEWKEWEERESMKNEWPHQEVFGDAKERLNAK